MTGLLGYGLLFLNGCAGTDHCSDGFQRHWNDVKDSGADVGQWTAVTDGIVTDIPREIVPSIGMKDVASPGTDIRPDAVLPASGPLRLSIEQAVLLALQRNRDLSVRQLNPVIAGTYAQIERGVYDPEWFADFTYEKERANETSRSSGSRFSVEGSDTAAVVGIRQALPTGTTIETTIEQERSISNRSPELQTARLGLSITQSLLRGFGPAVNLVDIRQAELEGVASIYELRGYVESLAADTEIAYWNYVLAVQEIAIYEQSLAIARQQLDEIEQRIDVGLLARIEAPAAKAELARRQQALIEARSLLEAYRLKLLRLINVNADGAALAGPNVNGADPGETHAAKQPEAQIHAISEPRIEALPIADPAERLQLARRLRPDLNEARLRLKQNRLETIVTRNGLLPRLDLFFFLGKTGFADTFTDSFRELDQDTYEFTAGVSLSRFIGNRAAKASDLAARAAFRQARKAVDNLGQIITLDVCLALNELERARRQIAASGLTREFEEQTAWAEKQQFDVGASTALRVAQAQRDLLASRIAEVRSVIHYRIALVKLYLAEGSLLERRGIRLAGTEVLPY